MISLNQFMEIFFFNLDLKNLKKQILIEKVLVKKISKKILK